MIGQTISHYKILEELGAGGMGVVYKAEDTKLKRTVALKFLSAQAVGTEEEKTRFVHEAQAAAALNHPHICTIHEIDERQGQSFIAMECVEGESLKTKIESGPLKLDDAIGLIIQVAEGLHEAHEKGIVHRDIKSANIMLTSKGQAKITDFGLAKLPGRTKLTKTGSTVGTLAYMSPEQAQGVEVDHRSDIWSLGVVFYELLTGKTPFKGDHEAAMVYSIMNQDAPPLREQTPEVPAELDSIVAKMLQKNPDDRYASTEELLSDLRNVQAGVTVQVALPMSRKAKRMAWGSSAVLVIAVVVSGVIMFNRGPGTVDARTLAVVDFDIIGGEEAPHLAEGLAEGISAKLSKLGSVRVVSSDDIRRLRKQDLSARDVASQMGAQLALGGSLLKTGEQIRVTPQLIDAATGNVIWSEPFDREFSNVLGFLDEVSLKIVDVLKLELDPDEKVALEEKPTESADAYERYLKGRHFYYRTTFRDNELAVKEFQNALGLDPDYALALAGLADAYVQRYKERYDYDEFWLDEAEKLIARALELDPDLGEAHESRSEVLVEKENLLGALEAAEKAWKLRPDWDEPYVRLGEIYQVRGERRDALEMYEQALAIRPSVQALCGRGDIYQSRGDSVAAEKDYRAAVALNPDHERPYIALGDLRWENWQQPQEAESLYLLAVEVRPDRSTAYERLIEVYDRTGLGDGGELARGFAEKFPYHWDAYETLFNHLAWDQGDFSAALNVIEEAASRNPERVWPHLLLAYSYAEGMDQSVQPEKAIKAVEQALALRPESGRVLHWAGAVYQGIGEVERAQECYSRALAVRPGSAILLMSVFGLFSSRSDFERAAEYGIRAIGQRPGMWSVRWYRPLENAMIQLGRHREYQGILETAAREYGQDEPAFLRELGRQQRLLGRFEDAISTGRQAVAIKEDDWSLFELGMSQWLSGDSDGALASLRKAQSLRAAARWIIHVLKSQGDFEQIEEYLEEIRTLTPGRISGPFIWSWFGGAYYASMRRFDDAWAVLEEAILEESNKGEATWETETKVSVAIRRRQMGDLDEARRLLENVVATGEAMYHSWVYRELVRVVAIQGNLEAAVELADHALANVPSEQSLLELQGRLLYARGRKEDALRVLREVKGAGSWSNWYAELVPVYRRAQFEVLAGAPNAEEHLRRALLRATRADRVENWHRGYGVAAAYRALVLARLGKPDQARKAIERSIRLEPERADIAYLVAAAYALAGDSDEALNWLQTAVERGQQELWWARVDPDLDPVRELPRFQEIMNDWDRRLRTMIN
jgi:non-specific serine/threonine protein kinase